MRQLQQIEDSAGRQLQCELTKICNQGTEIIDWKNSELWSLRKKVSVLEYRLTRAAQDDYQNAEIRALKNRISLSNNRLADAKRQGTAAKTELEATRLVVEGLQIEVKSTKAELEASELVVEGLELDLKEMSMVRQEVADLNAKVKDLRTSLKKKELTIRQLESDVQWKKEKRARAPTIEGDLSSVSTIIANDCTQASADSPFSFSSKMATDRTERGNRNDLDNELSTTNFALKFDLIGTGSNRTVEDNVGDT